MKKYRKQKEQNLTLQKMGHPLKKNALTYTIKNHAVQKVIDYNLIEEAFTSACFSHKHLVLILVLQDTSMSDISRNAVSHFIVM